MALDKIKKRIYMRDYFRVLRARVFEPHEFVKETHCRDCRRDFNRRYMNKWRSRRRDGLPGIS